MRSHSAAVLPKFLSTPSARRATLAAELDKLGPGISIHALREEGDQNLVVDGVFGQQIFLSTPSARRATPGAFCVAVAQLISIHALREEGDRWPWDWGRYSPISIHALREEGDAELVRSMP